MQTQPCQSKAPPPPHTHLWTYGHPDACELSGKPSTSCTSLQGGLQGGRPDSLPRPTLLRSSLEPPAGEAGNRLQVLELCQPGFGAKGKGAVNGGPLGGAGSRTLSVLPPPARVTFCSLESRAEAEISPAETPLGSSLFLPNPRLTLACQWVLLGCLRAKEGPWLGCLARCPNQAFLTVPHAGSPPWLGSAHPGPSRSAAGHPASLHPLGLLLQLPIQTSTFCLPSEGLPLGSQRLFLSIVSWGRGRGEEDPGFGITWVSLNSDLSAKVGLTHSCGSLGQVTQPPSASISPGRMEIMLLTWQGGGILGTQPLGWFKGSDSQATG